MAEGDEARRSPGSDQARRRRRRSIAIAVLLALLVILFYVMAIMHGPSIINRPL